MLNITIGSTYPYSPRVLEFALRKYTSIPLDIRHQRVPTPMHTPVDWNDHAHSVYLDSTVLCTSDPVWLYNLLSNDHAIQASHDMNIIVFNNKLFNDKAIRESQSTVWLNDTPWSTLLVSDATQISWMALANEMVDAT